MPGGGIEIKATLNRRQVVAFLKRLWQVPKAVEKAIDTVAILIQKDAKEVQILRGGRSAPIHPTQLTSRSGTLRRSIKIDRIEPLVRVIGTHLVYGKLHELGLEGFPPRPFLQPAMDKMAPKLESLIEKEVRELTRRGYVK
jgi:phage gpG-like protein